MGMVSEFREFIAKGNVMDLAVAVVIGAAFGKIVTAFVDKIIMPPIGLLIGGVDFAKWAIVLKGATVPAVTLGVGEFLNALIQFLIIALVVFLVVKAVNRMQRKQEPAPAGPTEDVLLLREIRDSLKR